MGERSKRKASEIGKEVLAGVVRVFFLVSEMSQVIS
jgi:hypothetical protein